MEDRKEFIEVQKFRLWWLWLIILIITLPLPVIIIYQSITHHLVGNHPASNTLLLVIFFIAVIPIYLLLYLGKLTVKINQDSIYYGFNFTSHSELKWGDIKDIAIIKYSFFGLGYKISSKYGEIFNTGGNTGLQITKLSGSKILLGTQNPGELKNFLSAIGKI